MIITCPSCAKRYAIPDNMISDEGREVRCDACGTQWFFKKPQPPLEGQETPKDPQGHPIDKKQQRTLDQETQNPIKKKSISSKIGWFLFLLSIVALISSVVVARHRLVQIFPATKAVFISLGLKVDHQDHHGLTFQNIQPLFQESHSGEQQISITGELTNKSSKTLVFKGITFSALGSCQKAPLLARISHFLDGKSSDNCVLLSWHFEPSDTKLLAGESVTFESQAPQKIEGAVSINMTLY